MNFSTNQVMQMFVLEGTDTAEVVAIKAPNGEDVRGYIVQIKNSAGDVIDTTDIIDAKNILSVTESLAETEQLKRKGLLVKLNPATLVDSKPIAGEDYVITLTYRGFGEEDTYAKVAVAKATKTDTAATLLQKLAESFILNADVEHTPLYELYTAEGAKVTKANYNTIKDTGFYIVEPIPYWSLGRFAETLMNIDVQTAPIGEDDETAWLVNYKFTAVPATITAVKAIPNSHRIADLEYFCKGERGTSNALVGWPDTPDYVAKVNPKSTTGYDVLTVHCAFVGANASNQKSEKDIIFVAEAGGEGLAAELAEIMGALNA
jgi:hypothetical protein